jgi:hypothetical protein
MNGVDASEDCTSYAAQIAAAGYGFVGRYYSQNASKALHADEAQSLCEAGLQLVTVYEDGPTSDSYFTTARAQADAQRAWTQAQAVGQPAGTAIYFAVDYDAPNAAIRGAIGSYFGAVATVLARQPRTYLVGIYGSGRSCDWMLTQGLAQRTWLAGATGWAGHRAFSRSNRWNIRQGGTAKIGALTVDTNESNGDFGAFTVRR